MYSGVKAVKALENYHLSLIFENGEHGIFDMTPYLEFGIFKDLCDETLFRSVHVSFDTVEWSNGADMCPELLYKSSVRSIEDPLETSKMVVSER